MQVDGTQVTIDKSEDPFKDFGPAIAENKVSYSSSLEEEEEKNQSQKRDEGASTERIVEELKVTTPTSAPIVTITPSTPPTSTIIVP